MVEIREVFDQGYNEPFDYNTYVGDPDALQSIESHDEVALQIYCFPFLESHQKRFFELINFIKAMVQIDRKGLDDSDEIEETERRMEGPLSDGGGTEDNDNEKQEGSGDQAKEIEKKPGGPPKRRCASLKQMILG